MKIRSRLRRGLLGSLLLIAGAGAALVASAEDLVRFSRNVPGESQSIIIDADDIATWIDGDTRILLLKGQVLVQQGVVRAQFQNGVVFVDQKGYQATHIWNADIYGEGEARVQSGADISSGATAFVDLHTRGELKLNAHKGKVAQEARADDPVFRRGAKQRAALRGLAAPSQPPGPAAPASPASPAIQQAGYATPADAAAPPVAATPTQGTSPPVTLQPPVPRATVGRAGHAGTGGPGSRRHASQSLRRRPSRRAGPGAPVQHRAQESGRVQDSPRETDAHPGGTAARRGDRRHGRPHPHGAQCRSPQRVGRFPRYRGRPRRGLVARPGSRSGRPAADAGRGDRHGNGVLPRR